MKNSNTKIIKYKKGLLDLAESLKSVTEACRILGFSRDTFYRYKKAEEEGGIEALFDKSRRVPNLKNRVDERVEKAVVEIAIEHPALGQLRVSNELRKRGIFVSGSGVRSIWQRHNLEVFSKRLKALESKAAEENLVFTESQLQALEKKQEEDRIYGEIETEHVGYLGCQDTFYVGHLKGVGRVYQQTYIDSYSKVAHCKLYTQKIPIVAADLLNDKVLPFYEARGVGVMRILTDRGTEYCGKVERGHDYEVYLLAQDIEHTRTKARSPQTNGICERFHKTILNEFYQITFRKKTYESIESLQEDLDQWLEEYNNERTHQGKMCNGRTPMETFEASVEEWSGRCAG